MKFHNVRAPPRLTLDCWLGPGIRVLPRARFTIFSFLPFGKEKNALHKFLLCFLRQQQVKTEKALKLSTPDSCLPTYLRRFGSSTNWQLDSAFFPLSLLFISSLRNISFPFTSLHFINTLWDRDMNLFLLLLGSK